MVLVVLFVSLCLLHNYSRRFQSLRVLLRELLLRELLEPLLLLREPVELLLQLRELLELLEL